MKNIKWIKIACDIFDDEAIKLIEQMPESDSIIVIWLKLLISAGKINDNGLVYFKKEIPYTDEMLSAVFNRPLNIVRLAISTFEKFGMIQITDEQQIFITNWEMHQNIAGMEQVKEYNRIAKRRQREKAKELKLLMDSQGQCQGHVMDNHETDIDKNKNRIDKNKNKEIEIDKEENKKKNFIAKSFFQKLIASDEEIKKYNFLSDSFLRFLQYKTDIKKQYKTEDSVKNAFLKFVRLANNDADYGKALIENAIARGWQSIYDLPKEDKIAFDKAKKETRKYDENYGGF